MLHEGVKGEPMTTDARKRIEALRDQLLEHVSLLIHTTEGLREPLCGDCEPKVDSYMDGYTSAMRDTAGQLLVLLRSLRTTAEPTAEPTALVDAT